MMKRRGYSVFRAVDLIVRSLLDKLSDTEQKEYERMLKDTDLSLDNWNGDILIDRLAEPNRFDTQQAYMFFHSRVTHKPKIRRIYWGSSAAAIWLLPLLAGGIVWWLCNSSPEEKITEQINPVATKAYIELADGQYIDLTTLKGNLSEQDGTLIRQDSGQLVYSGKETVGPEVIYNTLNVPRGGEYALVLADGTKVWMNSDSRLRYPVQFTEQTREVFLEGEAYFEVEKDTEHPFIVHTSLGRVEVLGTEFDVRDYRDEGQVLTTLVNGKVRYSGKEGKNCLLTPGYQALAIREGSHLYLREVNPDEYIGWKKGLYVFYDYTLERIMHTIERNYDVDVVFAQENLKNLRFSGELEKYDRIEKFLHFIELGGDIIFKIEGKQIRIEAK